MADIKALGAKKTGKGAPPAMTQAPRNTVKPPREVTEETVPLQLKIPASVYEEFSAEAAKAFGHKKGNKASYFMKLWGERNG